MQLRPLKSWSEYRGLDRPSGLLTLEQELYLGTLIQGKSRRDADKATAEMVTRNVRLVSHVAHSFRGRGIDMDDLMADGSVGLLYAARRYDPSKMLRFSTYAVSWIRQHISRGIELRGREIRMPAVAVGLLAHIQITRRSVTRQTGITPSDDQLLIIMSERIDSYPRYIGRQVKTLTLARMQELLACDLTHVISTADHPLDRLASADDPSASSDRQAVLEALTAVMSVLDERSLMVIQLRYGPDRQSLSEIGAVMGLSRERIRQICLEAVKTMGESPESNILRDTMGVLND